MSTPIKDSEIKSPNFKYRARLYKTELRQKTNSLIKAIPEAVKENSSHSISSSDHALLVNDSPYTVYPFKDKGQNTYEEEIHIDKQIEVREI